MRARHTAPVALGWVLWTGTEYAIHRGAFHPHPKTSGHRTLSRARRATLRLVGSEHRAHHRDPLATSLPLRIVGHLAVALASSVVPTIARRGSIWAGWVGFAAGYSLYETTHWRIHHRPQSISDARVEHHRVHHEVATRSNFGVTIPLWDYAFGTLRSVESSSTERLAPAVLMD